MARRIRGLAIPVGIGVAVGVAACSSAPGTVKPTVPATRSASSVATAPASATASTAASSSPPAAVPAGYRRIGGPAQGISIAAPASWVEVNLAQQTIESAAKKLSVHGLSTATIIKDMESLQKSHAVIVYNVAAAIASSSHYAPNLSAECTSSGVTEAGSAGVPFVKEVMATEFGKIAAHVTQTDTGVGGVPGVQTSYQIAAGNGTVYGSQLEVLPKPDKVCFVTLTAVKGQFDASVLQVAARTAQFP